jgi:hypothetical protein
MAAAEDPEPIAGAFAAVADEQLVVAVAVEVEGGDRAEVAEGERDQRVVGAAGEDDRVVALDRGAGAADGATEDDLVAPVAVEVADDRRAVEGELVGGEAGRGREGGLDEGAFVEAEEVEAGGVAVGAIAGEDDGARVLVGLADGDLEAGRAVQLPVAADERGAGDVAEAAARDGGELAAGRIVAEDVQLVGDPGAEGGDQLGAAVAVEVAGEEVDDVGAPAIERGRG